VQWRARLALEMGNLRAAFAWAVERGASGDPEPGLRLATALVPSWEAHGDFAEGRGRLAMALTVPMVGDAHTALRARSSGSAAWPTCTATIRTRRRSARRVWPSPATSAIPRSSPPPSASWGWSSASSAISTARHLEEALALSRALGDRAGTAFALLNLGATAGVAGDHARSTGPLAESLALFEEERDLRNIAVARSMLGLGAVQRGDHALAGEHLSASLAAHRDLGDRWFVIFDLLGLAEVLFAQGRRGEAARLLGTAQAIGELAGTDLALVGRVTFAPFLATAQGHLRESPFAAAWAEGRDLSLDRAVEYALALAGDADRGTPARPASPGPAAAPLTRREREVALLVARGRSDRQIAAALSISTATASLHVHRILAKLALRSRHQVAAWAATQRPATPPPS